MTTLRTLQFRLATAVMGVMFTSWVEAQISIDHVANGQCGELRVLNTTSHTLDITIYYTVIGENFGYPRGRRESAESTSTRSFPGTQISNGRLNVRGNGIDCQFPFSVGKIRSVINNDVTASNQQDQQRQQDTIQRILEREQRIREERDEALQKRREAEEQKQATAARKREQEKLNEQRWYEASMQRKEQEEIDNLRRHDQQTDEITRGTDCRIGRSINGTSIQQQVAAREAAELCVNNYKANQEIEKSKVVAEQRRKIAKATEEQARYNDHQQQQLALQQQDMERKRQNFQREQEETRRRTQQIADAKADLNNVLVKQAQELAAQTQKTQSLKRGNENLADLINNLK